MGEYCKNQSMAVFFALNFKITVWGYHEVSQSQNLNMKTDQVCIAKNFLFWLKPVRQLFF